jgi:translation elongation factor EF-1alpha
MTKIIWKQSKKTGNEKVMDPPHLEQFEQAEVIFEPMAPMFVESFDKCPSLGRICVMDSNRLKMMGKVLDVVYKDE